MLVQQEIKRAANPHQKFAIMHLLTRCLSDLLAAATWYRTLTYPRPIVSSGR